MCDVPCVISALEEYHDCDHTMDERMMADCPTKFEFDAVQPTTADFDEKSKGNCTLHTSTFRPL